MFATIQEIEVFARRS